MSDGARTTGGTRTVGRERTVQGVRVPTFLYGTAWKEARTASLVERALDAGFRGVDTANQPRHYDEESVGAALSGAFTGGGLGRDDVFVQTKFTFPAGQDRRIPYDPAVPVAEQVEQSFRSSLEHLGVERIDGYVLHGPSGRSGLAAADLEAWRAMERLHDQGGARLLGVSNVTPEQLAAFCDLARVPVAFVQNRCFARLAWDAAVRRVCEERGVVYQAFSLLTANPEVVGHPKLASIARRHSRTRPQVIFRLALELGMIPLTGTTDPRHMRDDLDVYAFELDPGELRSLQSLA